MALGAYAAFTQQRVSFRSRERLHLPVDVVLEQFSGHRVVQPRPATGARGVCEPRIPRPQIHAVSEILFVGNLLFIVSVTEHQRRQFPVQVVAEVRDGTLPVTHHDLPFDNLPLPLLRNQFRQLPQFAFQCLSVMPIERPVHEPVAVAQARRAVVAVRHAVLSWMMVATAVDPVRTAW